MGSSPAVRPFYDHGLAAALPPVRTALTTKGQRSAIPFTVITTANVSVPAGARLFAGLVYDNEILIGGIYNMTCDVFTLLADQDQIFSPTSNYRGAILSVACTSAIVNQPVTVDWTPSGSGPNCYGLVVFYVTPLLNPAFDKTASATGTSANPSSGATAVTSKGNEYVCGMICTDGPTTDALGAWQNGFTAGQRAGSTAVNLCDIREGFFIQAVAAAQTAAINGVTSRDWAALCCTYKGE